MHSFLCQTTYLVVVLIFFHHCASGQIKNTLSAGQLLLQKADSLIVNQSLDSAQSMLDSATYILLKERDTLGYFQSLNKKSLVYQKQVQYDSSLKVAMRGRELMDRFSYKNPVLEAEFYRRVGLIYEIRDSDLTRAAAEYRNGLKALNDLEKPPYLSIELDKDVVIILLTKGLLDSASKALDHIITKQEVQFPTLHIELADTYRLKAVELTISHAKKDALQYYKKAFSSLSKAEPSKRTEMGKAVVLSNLASLHHISGYYDSALTYYNWQKTIHEELLNENDKSLATLYNNLSSIYQFKGHFDSATYYGKKSLKIAESTLVEGHPDLARSYNSVAVSLHQKGKLRESLVYFLKSLDIIKSNFGLNHKRAYEAISHISLLYKDLRAYEISNEYLQQAISIGLSQGFVLSESLVRNYLYLADNLLDTGDLDEASKALLEADKLANNLAGNDHQMAGEVEMRRGAIFLSQERTAEAEKSFFNASKIFTNIYGHHHPIIGEVLNPLAKLKIENQELAVAKELLWKAIHTNTYAYHKVEFGTVPVLNEIINPYQTIVSLSLMAKVHWELSRKESDLSSLQKSYDVYNSLLSLLAEIFFEAENEDEITRTMEFFHSNYSDVVDLLYEMKEKGLISEEEHLSKYLNYSEASRAIASSYLRFRKETMNSLYGRSAQFDSLRLLNREIAFAESQLSTLKGANKDSERINYYQDVLFQLLNQKRQLSSSLEFEGLTYQNFLAERATTDVTKVQEVMNPANAIIEYFITENRLFTLLIKKDNTSLTVQQVHNSLFDHIDKHMAVGRDSTESYKQGSYNLYDVLIAPIRTELKGIEKLTVIPDKALWNVNFGLLLKENPDDHDYKTWPYLLRDYRISYAYTARSISKAHDHQESTNNGKMLALAFEEENGDIPDPKSIRNIPLAKIQSTAAEVKTLEKILKGDFVYGREATETLFKKVSSDYALLHLALHGITDDEQVNGSYLAFVRDSTQEEDGRLYPFELTGINLSADLAVLSACETGAGKIINGEGVMSVGRGFLNAGAKSLLLTQWPLSDAVAPKITERFYKNLSKGKHKDEALRLAQLDFLENANNITSNPYYWGSFFVLGDTAPIDLNTSDNRVYYVIIAMSILIAALTLRKIGFGTAKD